MRWTERVDVTQNALHMDIYEDKIFRDKRAGYTFSIIILLFALLLISNMM